MDLITDPGPPKFVVNGMHSAPFSQQYHLQSDNNGSPSSVYSSIDSSSPSSNHAIAFDPDDSGMDGNTNMSTCTSYFSMDGNTTCTTTTGFSSQHSSPSSTVYSFKQLFGNQSVPRFQNAFQIDPSSTPSSPFRSPSNSLSQSQRPRLPFMTARVCDQSPHFTAVPDEESTQMEYPSIQEITASPTSLNLSPASMSSVSQPLATGQTVSHDQAGNSCVSSPELRLLSQPSKNHRARYRTEGSRGAVKDRTGRSFPVIKLIGYNSTSAVKVRCFIGSDKNSGEAHLYYQVSKIIGKNITPCNVIKVDGIKMIEMDLLPENGFGAVVNCVGIVKERNFDVQRKTNGTTGSSMKRKAGESFSTLEEDQVMGQSNMSTISTSPELNENSRPALVSKHDEQRKQQQSNSHLNKRSTTCNLVFQCILPTGTLQTVSETINCAQILGSPEIHKISQTRDFFSGGTEVFVIGKNFTRESKIVWDFGPSSSGGQSIMRETEPEPDFMNQNHLIFKVPLLKSLLLDQEQEHNNNVLQDILENQSISNNANTMTVPVSLKIRCGEKVSEAIVFTFIQVITNNTNDGLNYVTSYQMHLQQQQQQMSGHEATKVSSYR